MPGVQQPPVNSVVSPVNSNSVVLPVNSNSAVSPVNSNSVVSSVNSNSAVLTATKNPSVTTASSKSPVSNCLVAKGEKKPSLPLGPPGMLDVDTMSRVIVDALAAGPNPAPSTYMNYVDRTSPPTAPSAKHSPVNDGGDSAGSGGSNGPQFGARGRSSSPESYQKTVSRKERSGTSSPVQSSGSKGIGTSSPVQSSGSKGIQSVASLTAESLLNAESQQPLGSATRTVAAIVSAKHTNSSTGGILPSLPNSPLAQSMEEEKPLNLSSSKVLHASHQQIIDHFIDKLLSSGGECAHGQYRQLFFQPFRLSPFLRFSSLSLLF